MARERVRVAIVGGGPGGLALAQGLRKNGIDFAVFEKDRTRADYVQGFRLRIRQRGLDALRTCLPEDLYEAVVATAGVAPTQSLVFDERFVAIPGALGWTSSEADDTHVEKSVSRITLRQVLLSGLGDRLRAGRIYAGYALNPDGTVTARFEDGGEVDCDLLVGADGATSRVRRQFLPHAGGFDTGVRRLAGKMTLARAAELGIPSALLDYNVVVQPREGRGLFITAHRVDPEAYRRVGLIGSEDEGHRDIGGFHFNNTTSYVWWNTAYRHNELASDSELEGLDGAGLIDLLLGHLAGWHPDIVRLVRHSDPSTVGLLKVRTSEPVEPWETGPVTLLGDAIHAMTYFRAIGGNSALYDAGVLTRELTAVEQQGKPLLQAVADYEAAMREHGYEAVRTSLANMERALGAPALAAA